MSRNKKTEILIARILTAVFLFVLISAPISVYAAGESASENESGDEYTDWSEAFSDSEYTENLADVLARYWTSTWTNYVGGGSDVIQDVATILGNQYDATKDLYENLYPYVLPYASQVVINTDPTNIPASYGHPKRDQNNLGLVQSLGNDLYDLLNTQTSDGFENISSKKNKAGNLVNPDFFPDYIHYSLTYPASGLTFSEDHSDVLPTPLLVMKNPSAAQYRAKYILYHPCTYTDTDDVIVYIWVRSYETKSYDFGLACYNANHQYVQCEWDQEYDSRLGVVRGSTKLQYDGGSSQHQEVGEVYIWGSSYLNFKAPDNQVSTYYWNQTDKTLYYLGTGNVTNYIGITDSDDVIGNYTVNVINTVDFEDYTDLINQLMLDVNMSNDITNSLLLELLLELRNQRNNFVQDDDSDIYDYIDYIMQKLIDVKDVHIEIPDISPDLGGIAEALTALLNFLASIIRTLGNIVTTLLDGLFHLFIPTDDDWDDIALDFEPLIRPFSWIKGFFVEGTSAISTCLFGYNVLDFDSAETEDVELVSASGSGTTSDGDAVLQIMYNENGAPKIPVHFSNSSSEIFSNIEDAYIIDLSWYTPFKPVGDIIVCAFCWIWFIWRVLHDLPGIISGATGIFDNDTLASVDNDADVFDHDLDKGIAFGKIFGKHQKTSFRNSNAVTRNGTRYQNRKMR